MADTGGFSLSMMPDDYSYVQPGGAGQSFDWSMPSFASMPDFGGFQQYQGGGQQGGGQNFDFSNAQYQTMPQGWGASTPQTYGQLPAQETPSIPVISNAPQQTLAPNTGNAGGSGMASQNAAKSKDDDWFKLLAKGGIGLGTAGLGALLSGMGGGGKQMTPRESQQIQTQLPTPPQAQAAPVSPELIPLPGTQASPLISGRPMQTRQSTGLQVQDRMRRGGSTGGLQLY